MIVCLEVLIIIIKYLLLFLQTDGEPLIYNFPVPEDMGLDHLMAYTHQIYRKQRKSFNINLKFGIILQDIETKEYRYFYPSEVNNVLDHPFKIDRGNRLGLFRSVLRRKLEPLQYMRLQRPNSRYKAVLVCNVRFEVTLLDYTLGCTNVDLPDF